MKGLKTGQRFWIVTPAWVQSVQGKHGGYRLYCETCASPENAWGSHWRSKEEKNKSINIILAQVLHQMIEL